MVVGDLADFVTERAKFQHVLWLYEYFCLWSSGLFFLFQLRFHML